MYHYTKGYNPSAVIGHGRRRGRRGHPGAVAFVPRHAHRGRSTAGSSAAASALPSTTCWRPAPASTGRRRLARATTWWWADHADPGHQPEHHGVDDPPHRRVRVGGGPGRGHRRGGVAGDGPGVDREPLRRGAGGARHPRRDPPAARPSGVDGYVIACFGDPGLEAARELARGPVVGIAEAAMRAATPPGPRSFSVVTTLARTRGRAWDLAATLRRGAGLPRRPRLRASRCWSSRPTRRPQDRHPGLPRRRRSPTSDVIVLGCAGMADLCARSPARSGCRSSTA